MSIEYIYINLDRRPDRRLHMEAELKRVGVYNFVRFPAIDGKMLILENMEEKKLFSRADYLTRPFKNAIIGNQLSHYSIWRNAIQNNIDYTVVFQDDVYFGCDDLQKKVKTLIEHMPKDALVLWLGTHEFALFNKFIPYDLKNQTIDNNISKLFSSVTNEHIGRFKPTVNPCSLAYIITLEGAKSLVNHFQQIGFLRATDHNMNSYLIEKNIYYGSLEILATGNPCFGSDIFT